MFKNYREVAADYITIVDTEFYPDYLDVAEILYKQHLIDFRKLVFSSSDAVELLQSINQETGDDRIQLLRIFRKYFSPDTSVEMLKVKSKEQAIIKYFSNRFRDIDEVREVIYDSTGNDDALIALLYEYKNRGAKGYELTTVFFEWFEDKFEDVFIIEGPRAAGKDIRLDNIIENFNSPVPADFIIRDAKTKEIKVIGFARYDSDRGGAQEDDRTSGNRDKVTIVREYAKMSNHPLKLLFLNDGPGLLLGSMWNDYSAIEDYGEGDVMVSTLKMLDERFTVEWISGELGDTTL